MFHIYVASILSECCIYLQMTFKCSANVLDVFASVSAVFGRMLQVFHMNVVKVYLVLYMLQWDSPAIAAYCSSMGAMHVCGKRRDGVQRSGGREKRRGWRQGRGRSLHEVGSSQQARGVGGPCLCVQETCNRRGRLSASHGVFSAT
jgi:hypothetical protein